MFIRRARFKAAALGLGSVVAILLWTGVAVAHHPVIEASAVCNPDGSAQITVVATAWDTDDPDSRVNNNVELSVAGQTQTGQFTAANDYSFSLSVTVPADGATYLARVVAIAAWGPNGEFGTAGEIRETNVTVPANCVAATTTTTTTTAPSPTTTAAQSPTTTVQVAGAVEVQPSLAYTGSTRAPLLLFGGASFVIIGVVVELLTRRRIRSGQSSAPR